MSILHRVLPGLLAAWAGLAAPAAEVPAPRLTWQVSPDRQELWLTLHDSAETLAIVECSGDLLHWAAGTLPTYLPGLTNETVSIPLPRRRPTDPAWWPQPPPLLACRVRALPRLREGNVLFANRVPSEGINAPVTYLGGLRPGDPLGSSGLASGADFLAQLHVIVPGGGMWRVGQPVPFRQGSFAGYIASTVVAVPLAVDTDKVTIIMTAWVAAPGYSYDEAVGKGVGGYGTSDALTIRPTSFPAAPAPLVGLQAFNLVVPIGGVPRACPGILPPPPAASPCS